MKSLVWIFAILQGFLALTNTTFAREPVPFQNPYQDGFLLIQWMENHTEEENLAILADARRIGAKHIIVPVMGCQSTLTSSDVDWCDSESFKYRVGVARLAQSAGFDVSFLPFHNSRTPEWRGFIDPDDEDLWFANYTKMISGLAALAQTMGHKEFIVATELGKLYRYDEHWRGVVREVRKHFSGPVVLTANWDALDHPFWDELDAIGISAYFPLSVKKDPSLEDLEKGWKFHRDKILKVSKKWKRPVHLTEVGYPSRDTAARYPWDDRVGNYPNHEMQARCFEAFRKTWQKERGLARANIWHLGGTENQEWDPVGKPSELVLSQFFEARSKLGKRWYERILELVRH